MTKVNTIFLRISTEYLRRFNSDKVPQVVYQHMMKTLRGAKWVSKDNKPIVDFAIYTVTSERGIYYKFELVEKKNEEKEEVAKPTENTNGH